MNAVIIQPMNELSESEIEKTYTTAKEWLESEGYTVVDLKDKERYQKALEDTVNVVKNIRMYLLGQTIQEIAKYDIAYFCKDWNQYRGCRIIHDAVVAYGIQAIYEEEAIKWQ